MSRPVALIGPQGAGKTTLAELLVEHRGYCRHPIATGIRRVVQMAYEGGVAKGETIEVQRFSGKVTLTGRELMQEIGMALRDVDLHIWLRIWSQGYSELWERGIPMVVDDVRLPSEVQMLRVLEPEIIVVRVHADAEVRRERRAGEFTGTGDITETGWEGAAFDATIDTTAVTVQEAYAALVAAIDGGSENV
jgi:dephospho-CoA kinase